MNPDDKKTTGPLDGLAAEADALNVPLGEGDTDLDVAARDGQVQPQQSNAELLAGAFRLVRDTVTQLADVRSIQATLNDGVTDHLGQMWGQVLDSYGIRLDAYLGRHGALIGATIATLAIGRNVLVAYRAEAAAKAQAKGEEGPTPTPAPPPPGEGAAQ